MSCDIRIGTSGWHYKWWLGNFYPADLPASAMLAHYLQSFDTVELNNTFYHLPLESTLDNWRQSVPMNFLFAAKGSRFLTHMKKLKDPEEGIARYFQRVDRLGKRLGPIIWQLPPRWKKNVERLETFLRALPKKHRYSFEFRDVSWHDEEVYEVLRRYKAAFCIYEIAGVRSQRLVTTDFVYVRLHGPTDKPYQGSYSPEALRDWADQIRSWSRDVKAIYFYFDNDHIGHAARNALELKRLVELPATKARPPAKRNVKRPEARSR